MDKRPVVLFDLLTACLDSWTVWNRVAGSEAAGRAWRAEYLRLTYGCGSYVAYEDLVRQAAASTGMPPHAPDALEAQWSTLPPWSGVVSALQSLADTHRLGVVTNCSVRLGRLAAECVPVRWDCVVTAEEAGFYKPDPAPYRLALARMGADTSDALFVAGSGYDLFGTAAVGLRTFWHNRAGLAAPPGAPAAQVQSRDVGGLVEWVRTNTKQL